MVLEIAVAKIHKAAPFDRPFYMGCGVTTGVGAVIWTAKVETGARVIFGLGGIGLNVIQGAKMVGAAQIIGVDVNSGRRKMAEEFGMTDFVNPKEVERGRIRPPTTPSAGLVDTIRRGRRETEFARE